MLDTGQLAIHEVQHGGSPVDPQPDRPAGGSGHHAETRAHDPGRDEPLEAIGGGRGVDDEQTGRGDRAAGR